MHSPDVNFRSCERTHSGKPPSLPACSHSAPSPREPIVTHFLRPFPETYTPFHHAFADEYIGMVFLHSFSTHKSSPLSLNYVPGGHPTVSPGGILLLFHAREFYRWAYLGVFNHLLSTNVSSVSNSLLLPRMLQWRVAVHTGLCIIAAAEQTREVEFLGHKVQADGLWCCQTAK